MLSGGFLPGAPGYLAALPPDLPLPQAFLPQWHTAVSSLPRSFLTLTGLVSLHNIFLYLRITHNHWTLPVPYATMKQKSEQVDEERAHMRNGIFASVLLAALPLCAFASGGAGQRASSSIFRQSGTPKLSLRRSRGSPDPRSWRLSL